MERVNIPFLISNACTGKIILWHVQNVARKPQVERASLKDTRTSINSRSCTEHVKIHSSRRSAGNRQWHQALGTSTPEELRGRNETDLAIKMACISSEYASHCTAGVHKTLRHFLYVILMAHRILRCLEIFWKNSAKVPYRNTCAQEVGVLSLYPYIYTRTHIWLHNETDNSNLHNHFTLLLTSLLYFTQCEIPTHSRASNLMRY
jgi:hypothetical protein